MASDEYGEIPDPWARSAYGREYARVFRSSERPCVGGPLHRRRMPEDNLAFVVEAEGAFHTYKLMRDIASGELCYVHIGSLKGAADGSTGSDPMAQVALDRRGR